MKRILFFVLAASVILLSGCAKSLKAGTYEGTAKGYGGTVAVQVELSKDKIVSVKITDHQETPGIGSVAIERIPASILTRQSLKVDSLSGATHTSNAVKEAVINALKTAGVKPIDIKEIPLAPVIRTAVTKDTDIVIIGAGGAGMVAALEAKNAGKKVVVLEKTAMSGGNTTRSTGGMNAAETKEQAASGIKDSVQLFIDDTMKGGQNKNDRNMVTTLAKKSAEGIEWLKTVGVNLTNVGLFGGASVKRIHRPVDAQGKVLAVGTYLVPILETNVKNAGIEILYETPATEIIMKDGVAVGVKAISAATDYTINAKAVVVTTGGFGANADLYTKYRPELNGFVTTNIPAAQGDGIKMAEAIGAATVDMEQIQIHPTVESTGALITEGLRGDGAILVNSEGKRFVNELETRDKVSAAEVAQKGGFAYLVIDQAMVDASNVIKGYVKSGFTVSGNTYEELGTAIGADGKILVATMAAWNKAVADNKDSEFGRAGMKNDLSKAPFYAIKIAPGVHHTMGGIKINTNTEVLSTQNKVIPGLYAAGEVTGGIHGANRLGGNAVADIVVFGRVAGQNAAAYVK